MHWPGLQRGCKYLLIIIGVAFTGCFVLVWLQGKGFETSVPFPRGLPQQEIVFSPDAPHLANPQSRTLGFLNADGTGRREYSITLYEGARSMIGTRMKTSQGLYPRWSYNGELLFSIRGVPPAVRVIDQRGRMFGTHCDTLEQGRLTFDLEGNILAPFYQGSEVYQRYQGYAMPRSVLIARHNLKNCRINGILLLPIAADPRFVNSIGENPYGWLVADFYDFEEHTYKILLYHPENNVQRIFPGRHPSFSDDGEWLAYYRSDGYLVVQRVTSGEEFPLVKVDSQGKDILWAREFSMPGWSPDSEWLVYNDSSGKMYKIHRENGQQVYLGDGWSPDWR